MKDENWIKTLATANYVAGQWQTENPTEIERQLALRIRDSISQLFLETRDVCDSFNNYSKNGMTIKLLPIEAKMGGHDIGLMLLLGKAQLKVIFENNMFHTSLIVIKDFKTDRLYSGSFIPTFDALGSLYWKSELGVLMDLELMVKTIFEIIVKQVAAPR